jgi:pimeloyl-ACP methyl ester carboxylesterase
MPAVHIDDASMTTRLFLSALALLLFGLPASAKVFDKTAEIAGMTVHYKVALPKEYDPQKIYPAVLAFPPGSQTMDMVLTTLEQNWRMEGDRRGYIVIVPAAPYGRPFVAEGAKIFPEFIEKLLREYKVRDNKFHIAGMSNGGRSAFHIAASHPQYFRSVIGFPGYLPDPTPERVAALSKMCIYMHVGEFDTDWLQQMKQQASMFRSKGYSVHFTVERGEGHVMRTLIGERSARLFKEMEEARQGCSGATSR